MTHSFVSTLVKAFGLHETAARLLESAVANWPSDAEEFFLAHWTELHPADVFVWLARSAPADDTRPYARIVPRLVPHIAERTSQSPYLPEIASDSVRRIANQHARDEFVEQLRDIVGEQSWQESLLPLADGCPLFKSVVHGLPTKVRREPPYGVEPRHPIAVAATLFDRRRDEAACVSHLQAMVRDRATTDYALWLLGELGQLRTVVTPSLLLEVLPSLWEVEPDSDPRVRFRHDVALELSTDTGFPGALARRALDASARGVPWAYLWWETPEQVRDELALASLGSDDQAPWAPLAIRRRFSGLEFWTRILTYCEHGTTPLTTSYEHFHRAAARWQGSFEPDVGEELKHFWSPDLLEWLRTEPLPANMDEATETRLIAVLRRAEPVGADELIARRLLELPRTAERARRVVAMLLTSGGFYSLRDCAELAVFVGPVAGHVPRPQRVTPRALTAYAALTGDPNAIVRWFDEAIAASNFWDGYELAVSCEALRTPGAVRKLKDLMPSDDLGRLLHFHATQPWLLSLDEAVDAAQRLPYPDEQWRRLGTPPQAFLPVLERKLLATESVDLARHLVERMAKIGMSRRALVSLVVKRLEQRGLSALEPYVLGGLLESGKLWEDQKQRLVGLALDDRSTVGAHWLGEVARVAAHHGAPPPAIHAAVAEVVIERASTALRCGDLKQADALLRGLTRLGVPARLFREVRALRKLPNASALNDLFDANEALMSRQKADDRPTDTLSIGIAISLCAGAGAPDDDDDPDPDR